MVLENDTKKGYSVSFKGVHSAVNLKKFCMSEGHGRKEEHFAVIASLLSLLVFVPRQKK